MVSETEIFKFLELHLNEARFKHSIRVMETAEHYAGIWGIDHEKAHIAGLLHDCGKWKSKEDTLKTIEKFGIILSDEEKKNYNLVHGALGSYIAKNVFYVEDEEILNAIKYHIAGRKNMTDLEKIIYLADKLEPKRDYVLVNEHRKLAEENLNLATRKVMEDSISYLIKKEEYISLLSVEARNSLL
ncbi:MAG: bis(5'-nucleosyl)-tetraphosphatase (symmetrical) YqeK [Ezakiella sp.]|nr:bis(5'-nucleosyl)-tetraphosphatase (symmetrical) YqeK [Ezakiella sp.]MDD7471404.1 bis(5'-nucleosyl)-tetraphosphatase (symmetrical) YqeK [Bacillota bacterium]MDY3922901.1 bis(5'-nucleosyl)-tetraphosphatase (symmetrical) YqeK [Ezakiella sp.]